MADCDDDDPCTIDACEAGSCAHAPLAPKDLIVCLVAGSADACASDAVPQSFERKLARAANVVERALLRRPAVRRRLLGIARKLLLRAGRKLGHAEGLSADCIDQLQAGIAEAVAYVDGLAE